MSVGEIGDRPYRSRVLCCLPRSVCGCIGYLLSGDFNKDGRDDLLFHWKSTGTNRLYLSNAQGSFDSVSDPMNVTLRTVG